MDVSILYSILCGGGSCGSGDEGRVCKTSMGETSMGKSGVGNASMSNMGNRVSDGVQGRNMGNMGHSGLVDSDVMLVNDRGLDDMVNGVDLVGLRNEVGLFNLNGVGLGHVLLNDDFPFDGDRVGNGNLDGVFLNLKLGFDTFDIGSDDGVSPDRCLDLGDGDGVSRCWSLVGGWRRNSSIRCRCNGDGWWGNGHSGLRIFGGTSNISVGRSLAHALFLGVSKASLHTLGAHLDLAVANNGMMGLGHSGTSMDMFLHSVTNHGVTNVLM